MSLARQQLADAPGAREQPANESELPLRLVVAGVCLVACVALVPFWVPLVIAAWTAVVVLPLHQRLAKRIHRRKGAAVLITVLLVIACLTPLLIATLSLSSAALQLGRGLSGAGSGAEALRFLATSGDGKPFDFHQLNLEQIIDMARRHGAGALGVARLIFGAATTMALDVVVFVAALYTFLYDGRRLHEWLLLHAPLSRGRSQRLSNVFAEVGRGLLIGVALTALLQGAVATIGYLVCGVPQALVLGLVTVIASLIPSVGSALVWVPVTAGLAISGRPGTAVIMLVIGGLVSIVDNLVRPALAKYGELRMHGLLLFVGMLGGITVFGAGGLFLGPLALRLAIEGLTMLREARIASAEA